MKKVIFGILSFLLISPVFAVDYNLGNYTKNIFFSFESMNSNNNITFGFLPFYHRINSTSIDSRYRLFYFGDNLSVNYNISGYLSDSIQTGNIYSDSNGFTAFSYSGDELYSFNRAGYGLFSVSQNYYEKLTTNFFGFYQQAGPNYTLSFVNYPYLSYSRLINNNSYIRFLYNFSDGLWFSTGSFPGYSNSSARYVQYFQKLNPIFETERGKARLGLIPIDKVVPSAGNGFSFISSFKTSDLGSIYYDDLKLYSVFPFWDSSWDSNSIYTLPSSTYSDDFYVFRLNSSSYHSDYQILGVISKCNIDLCSGFNSVEHLLSSMVYSEYICDFSDSFDIKNECILVGGGVLDGVLGSISGYEVPISSWSNNFIRDLFSANVSDIYSYYSYEYNPVSISISSDLNNLYISNFDLTVDGRYHSSSITSSSFPLSYTGGYSVSNPPDILSIYDFSVPEVSHGSGALDILCQDDIFGTNPLCNNDLGGTWSELTEDGSGNLVLTIYDDDFDMPGPCDNGYFTGEDGRVYYQYFDSGNNYCIKNYVIPSYTSSPEIVEYFSGSDLTGLESSIRSAFSDIIGPNFKFYSCPFRSPLKAFHLSSIGGLSDFLLDKFFDVNITGPFNCLLGGILYSVTDSQSLGTRLLLNSYNGEKYLNNFSDDFKNTISWLLFAGMVLFFWSFRPKEH